MIFSFLSIQFRATWRFLILFSLGILLTLGLFITVNPSVQAQMPDLPSNVRELVETGTRPLSGQIGNLVYSPVKVDGMPIFYVTIPASLEDKKDDKITLSPLQDRVKRIENNIQEIIDRGFDPDTLQIYPSVLNGQTVIRASDQKNLKPQTIGTITDYDAQLQGLSVEELAPEITNLIRHSLLKARRERQVESLQAHARLAAVFVGILVLISIFLNLLQQWLTQQIYALKKALSQFLKTLDTQVINPVADVDDIPISADSTTRRLMLEASDRLFFLLYLIGRQLKVSLKLNSIPHPQGFHLFEQSPLASFLINPNKYTNSEDIKQFCQKRIEFLIFLRRLISLIHILIWLRGIALILTFFPHSRLWGVQMAGTPTSLIIIWLLIFVSIKIIGFLIDQLLKAWEEDIRLVEKASSRKALRIPTLSNALKSIFIFMLLIIGVIFSLNIFDVAATTILAGAGLIGFAISFGSQSLIKDLIAGLINLFNDAYAVGDFVIIGTDQGLVEDLNLFVTRLRNSNGDLITIPNGSILTVCNQTKDWSRVDYTVQVAYDTDIYKALTILNEAANSLYDDPYWHSLMLDAPDIKGVEELSHQGVMLRIWLKTKPGEQWILARELRLRLKVAFEQAGISIGIPKQTFLMQSQTERLPSIEDNS